MSGTAKMRQRPKSTKVTVWRELLSLRRGEYAKYSARRGARRSLIVLRVTLRDTNVVAWVRGNAETSGIAWAVTRSDQRNVAAAIAVAKKWAETEADKLAGAS